jgi:DNA-binding transcriptional LysR family regulator
MTLTQFRYVVAIADSGLNITLAADRVHATQPGISKQLKQLEDELGFQIFARKGKSLERVTPAGAQVIERARVILAEATNIRALAANLRHETQGELRIATTHTQARFVLPRAVAALKRRYPQVSVHLKPAGDAEVLSLLERGEADIAIVSSAGSAPQGGLAVPLFRWERVILVPRGHELSRLTRTPTLDELAEFPLVSYESSLKPESSLRRAFLASGKLPKIALTARDADLIKTYVRAGLGVGVLAEMALTPEDAADLRVLPADGLFPTCTAWVVLRRDRVLRDYALELLQELAPQLDRRDLRRVLDGSITADWATPPSWRDLTRASATPASEPVRAGARKGGLAAVAA